VRRVLEIGRNDNVELQVNFATNPSPSFAVPLHDGGRRRKRSAAGAADVSSRTTTISVSTVVRF
jgi:hypothetical protein